MSSSSAAGRWVGVEQMESRRLLAFAPAGPAIIVQPATDGVVTGVESVAGLDNGEFAAAWISAGNGFVGLFDALGEPVANPVQFNSTAVANIDVGIAADSSFAVTWQETDGDGEGIFVQRFDNTGAPVGGITIVNTNTAGDQLNPRIGMAGDGTFTIIWQSDTTGNGDNRILQQRFAADGTPAGIESLASEDANAILGDIAMNGTGAYVVTWNSDTATLAQLYDNTGALNGAVVTVDAAAATSRPAAGISRRGLFAIAWTIDNGTDLDVVAQVFDSSGTPTGTLLTGSANPGDDEDIAQLSMAGSGSFAVGWVQADGEEAAFRVFTDFDAVYDVEDTVIPNAQFTANERFGLAFTDRAPLLVGFAASDAGNGAAKDDGVVQPFTVPPAPQRDPLVITLSNNGDVLDLYGSTNVDGELTVTQKLNGVTTTIDGNTFGGISIIGGTGDDYIRAKGIARTVTVTGSDGNDTIRTGDGNDSVDAGAGEDIVQTGDGNDYAIGGDGNDTLFGGNGRDTLTGAGGRAEIHGESGSDLLTGGNRPDTIFGENGNDRIRGREGGDAIFGGLGDDTIDGGEGNDGILGDAGDDELLGSDGFDTLRGGIGNDHCFGQNDNDTLFGDLGNDTLEGNLGFDRGFVDETFGTDDGFGNSLSNDVVASIENVRIVRGLA